MFIVGLGNRAPEYDFTRHNAGKDAVVYCADKFCGSLWVNDSALHAKYKECDNHVFFIPETYMNVSGDAVYEGLEAFSFLAEEMIVVHDELDLEFGKVKISFGAGSAGHKGVESIINKLQTNQFTRIRIGIHPEHEITNKSSFVLGKFTPEQMEKMNEIYKQVCKAIDLTVNHGLQKAMNEINK